MEAVFVIEQYKNLAKIAKNTVDIKKETREILDVIIKAKDKELTYNMFFVYLVTVLEVYLKDRIVEEMDKDPSVIEKFLKGYAIDRKITPEDLLQGPRAFVLSIIDNTSFHNLKKVEAIYNIVFGFKILRFGKYKILNWAVQTRHSIVHRGAALAKKEPSLNVNYVIWTCQEISNFIEGVDFYIRYRRKRKRFPNLILRHAKVWDVLMEWEEYKDAYWDLVFK
ncbi:MAG: hypothetical protein E3J35_06400 [Methanomassiliicoccales archaeon]|nr:MAG: hypothetical protein E3J35_06400 [Methanomassiliicoccales archaeon]